MTSTPAGNPLDIVRGVNATLPALRQAAPKGLTIQSTFDVARYINASISEVLPTLVLAIAIVVVIFGFLGSLSLRLSHRAR